MKFQHYAATPGTMVLTAASRTTPAASPAISPVISNGGSVHTLMLHDGEKFPSGKPVDSAFPNLFGAIG